jgi:hypothetical protein
MDIFDSVLVPVLQRIPLQHTYQVRNTMTHEHFEIVYYFQDNKVTAVQLNRNSYTSMNTLTDVVIRNHFEDNLHNISISHFKDGLVIHQRTIALLRINAPHYQ